jgi:hypothetical protein
MTEILADLAVRLSGSLGTTIRDVVPIVLVIAFFQLVVLRRRFADPARLFLGLAAVVVGLAVFLVGLEIGLFPLGRAMARQLSDPAFLARNPAAADLDWTSYRTTYLFAFCLGFATTIAEPALISVAVKAGQVSGGGINPLGLRIAVALGAGTGVALGVVRICAGISLPLFMIVGYVLVVIQTFLAPRAIVPLAYDSGGVTTSTVTVPMVAALGLGLAEQLPGRSPLVDGFGLIASAALCPMLTVMGYAQLSEWWSPRRPRAASREG